MLRLTAAAAIAVLLMSGCSTGPAQDSPALTIGAIYPLSGPQAKGGSEEFAGLRAALEVAVHAKVRGARLIHLRVIDVQTPEQAVAAVDRLAAERVTVIVGSYGSSLSVAAATRADALGVVFWETGAVADDVTNHRRWVFRTVATGSTLGRTAAKFTASVLMPVQGQRPSASRVVVLHTNDYYGRSVAAGEAAEAAASGVGSVTDIQYDPHGFDPDEVARQVADARPDYFWDVSYLDDGVSVWRALLARGVRLRGAVGTSSAFCMPDFQKRLGDKATGVFAADKPDEVVGSEALTPRARALLKEAVARYGAANAGHPMGIPGIAGFVGGWTLFETVLGHLANNAGITAEAVRAAASLVDVPVGDTINGGGVKFSPPGSPDAGQNLRAPAVVGQWQPGGLMKVVYPREYATGQLLPELINAAAGAPSG